MYLANSNINFISLPPESNVKITFGDDVQTSLSIRFYTAVLPKNSIAGW